MKLIIDIPDELFSIFKKHGIMAFDYVNEYDKDQIAIAITHGTPYNPSGDCISREALKNELIMQRAHFIDKSVHTSIDNDKLSYSLVATGIQHAIDIIDNAQAVDIKDEIAGAYNEGYMCGNREAEKARPQGEYVDISKLRLMTVEECAGHTIEYAMGWKACIEWIKKGGTE